MKLPEPLTPRDLDLRDFEWMPLHVVRLRDSGIVVIASAEAFRAAVLLWCASWHQVPAASLPKEEKMLCSLAGFGRDLKAWRSLASEALHGFVECSDGRLYHPVIAAAAIESGSKKKKQGRQTAAATEAARLARLARDAERNGDRDGLRHGNQGRGEDLIGPDKTGSEKTGESPARPDLKVVGEGEAVLIDLSYEPSERAIEYAYSLGMKAADLKSELSKFIALSMGSRARSYNPDMTFKAWCDRWLDFKRRDNPDWQPPPPPAPTAPAEPFVVVIQDTMEASCWAQYLREKRQRGLFFCKQLVDGVEVVGARAPSLVPPGYDEATGERIAPAEENAA